MTIEYKDSKRIVALSTDVIETVDYETDFSSSTGWTTVGSNISITGGVIQASSMATQSDNRIYYDLGSALSDQFVIDFDHYADTASLGGFWQMFALTDTTSIPRTDDSIHALIDMGTWSTYLRYSNEGSETNLALAGSLTTGQWQYIRFVRDGTTGTLTVYSDSARTNQVLSATGTIPATVTGLRYFQSGALASANSGTTTYKIDNLKVYDGETSLTSKPTNVQDNSLLVEKDTARRYWHTPNTVTFQSDFSSSTGWTTTGSKVSIDTTDEEIDFSFNTDNGDLSHTYYDLTSVSDTKWVLRSQIDIDTVTQGSDVNDVFIFYGIGSTNQNGNESQDFLGLMFRVDNTKTDIFAIETDGTDPNNETTTLFTRQLQEETLYVEMIRESATSFTINLYSNSNYSTLLESKTITVPSSVQTLRYLKVAGLQGFSDSVLIGSVSNITLYDGVTEPATWNMQPTLGDDFSTDNFVQTGTEIDVSGGELVWDANPDSTTTGGYIDFGENLSDTAWVCRFKVKVNNYSDAVTTATNFYIQFQNITTVNSTTSRDSMGIHLRLKSGNTDWRVEAVDGSVAGGGAGNLIDGSPTTETIYVQMYRDGNTIYAEWYDNADYTGTPTNTANHSSGTPANLRYFAVYRRSDVTTTGVSNGIIDDLEIYNGVTSIN